VSDPGQHHRSGQAYTGNERAEGGPEKGMGKPTWIVFEGIDGSGKTTQAKRLNEYLNNHGLKSLYKHVFDSRAGRLLREMFIDNSFSNTVEILILCAARQAFLDEVAAQADEYDVLIVDRFFLSILAMQGNDDEDIGLINYIQESVCHGREHIVFHMRTSPEDCKSRLKNRLAPDRIEEKGVEFHRMVSDRYLKLLRQVDNVHHIDGSGDIEEIHRSVVDKTLLLLGAADSRRAYA
jgi:dTMP kinase